MKGYVIRLNYIVMLGGIQREFLSRNKGDVIGTPFLLDAKLYKTKSGALKKAKKYEQENEWLDMRCSLMYVEDVEESD